MMISRKTPFLIIVLALSASSGCCCNMKDFFFGRGARCGLGAGLCKAGRSLNPFGNSPVAAPACGPRAAQPMVAPPAHAPAPPYGPAYAPSAAIPAPSCGCNSYAGMPAGDCGSCNANVIGGGYAAGMVGSDCNCGSPIVSGYGGHDPYLNSGSAIYGEQIVPGSMSMDDGAYIPSPAISPAPLGSGLPDNFNRRFQSQRAPISDHMTESFDASGDRIINRSNVN